MGYKGGRVWCEKVLILAVRWEALKGEHIEPALPGCVRPSSGPTVKYQAGRRPRESTCYMPPEVKVCVQSWQGAWQRDLLKIWLYSKPKGCRRKNASWEKSEAIAVIFLLLHKKLCSKLGGLKHPSYRFVGQEFGQVLPGRLLCATMVSPQWWSAGAWSG